MEPTDTTVEHSSGNVFADLGFLDADAHLVKAELVSRIDDIVRDRDITQTEAARLMGLSRPDVSRLLRGDFREYSLERLFRLLNALGRDIDIVIDVSYAEIARILRRRLDGGVEAARDARAGRLVPVVVQAPSGGEAARSCRS